MKGPGREEVMGLVQRLLSGRVARQEREVLVTSRGRERNLAVTVVPLPGPPGFPPGAVIVPDASGPFTTPLPGTPPE